MTTVSHLLWFTFMDRRAVALMEDKKFKDALEVLEPVCNWLKTDVNFGEHNATTLRIEFHIGVCLFETKQFRKSKQVFGQVDDKAETVFGKGDVDTLRPKYMLAKSLQTLEEHIKAISLLKEVCKLFNPVTKIVSGDNANPKDVRFYEDLKNLLETDVIVVLEAVDRLRQAEKYKEALKILKPLWKWLKTDVNYFGEEHGMTLETKFLIGHSYFRIEENEKAKDAFESIVTGMEKVHGIEHEKTLDFKFFLALSYELLNELETAFDIFPKLLPLQVKVLGKTDTKTILNMEHITRLVGGVVNPLNKLESYEIALKKRMNELEDEDKDGDTNDMKIVALKELLAYAYQDNGTYDQALAICSRRYI